VEQSTVVLIKPQNNAHLTARIFAALVELHIKADLRIGAFDWLTFNRVTASKF
jgi:hypothetical protein